VEHIFDTGALPWLQPPVAMDVMSSMRHVVVAQRLVRGETRLNNTVYLAPYDPDWTKQFSLHAKRIRDALSKRVLLVEHVGSTSVPGLSAKPVIDMVLAVSNLQTRHRMFRCWSHEASC
jgi:GrpB-like predicted nucleotidyltransferase (UPF0157 family)